MALREMGRGLEKRPLSFSQKLCIQESVSVVADVQDLDLDTRSDGGGDSRPTASLQLASGADAVDTVSDSTAFLRFSSIAACWTILRRRLDDAAFCPTNLTHSISLTSSEMSRTVSRKCGLRQSILPMVFRSTRARTAWLLESFLYSHSSSFLLRPPPPSIRASRKMSSASL